MLQQYKAWTGRPDCKTHTPNPRQPHATAPAPPSEKSRSWKPSSGQASSLYSLMEPPYERGAGWWQGGWVVLLAGCRTLQGVGSPASSTLTCTPAPANKLPRPMQRELLAAPST